MKLCALHRFAIGWALDQGRPLPGPTRRHIGRCGACLAMQEGMVRVHGLLLEKGAEIRAAAIRSPLGLPLSLEDVRRPAPSSPQPRRSPSGRLTHPPAGRLTHPRLWRPLTAAAAAALLLATGILIKRAAFEVADAGGAKSMQAIKPRIDSLALLIAQASQSDPLEGELQGLMQTARSAADFLRGKLKKL